MPLVLKRSGGVFLHCMKTGGSWVREALTAAGAEWTDVDYQHLNCRQSLHISPGRPRFTAVRNPFLWYASFWSFRQQTGWGGDRIISHTCKSDDFGEFVRLCCRHHPGFLGNLYLEYAAPGVTVMRTDALGQCLLSVLSWLGEPFDAEKLLRHPPENVCAGRDRPAWTLKTARLLVKSEQRAFQRWGWPTEPPALHEIEERT